MGESMRKLDGIKDTVGKLATEAPELKNFMDFVKSAEEGNVLDAKTKELITFGISVAIRCEPCILWHAASCLELGATREELLDVIKVAIVMAGGPGMMYATKAYEIIDELTTK